MAPETKVNGINIDQLFSTIDLLKQKPELAKFQFRVTNKWLGGGEGLGRFRLAHPGRARKMNDPMGRRGSLMPERARISASATSFTASSCPTTR